MKELEDNEKVTGLPENAYRELKEGETYHPVMSPQKQYKEVTPWSVCWGLVMAVIFSAAAAYLGLKVGQVFEAAIPIAIISVGLSNGFKRKNALGENVIIQSIGANSGVIVAGAIFTLPALYILQEKYPEISVNFFQVFLSSLLGGILGILLLIPFRKYFVSDMHGKYPFPEATATTQVLVSGEKGGKQVKPLITAGIVGGLYDFIAATFGWWSENVGTRIIDAGAVLADKAKLVFKVNTGAAVLGLGYIIGLRYSIIICAGSFLVWFIIIPLLPLLFSAESLSFGNSVTAATDLGNMSAEDLFTTYARHIGIGGIATAGIIGIIKSWGIIKGAAKLATNEIKNKNSKEETGVLRTQKDISMKIISIGIIATLIAVFAFFHFGLLDNWLYALIGVLIVGIITFLFTTVAANAIAIVGSNPVSGMTLMTLILASIILVACGLSGTSGMVSALIIGGVVCTALSMAGGFITDLKIGYWLGSSPAKQETWKFLGTLVSAATVGGVIMILNQSFGFTTGQLAAPQANAMAAVIEPLMSGSSAPWNLYLVGAIIVIILNWCKIPALAFALGMFIPLELNTPLLIGGAINWYIGSRSKDKELNAARVEKGTLLASGFIAGGALMGVVSSALRFADINLYNSDWASGKAAEWIAVAVYIALIGYLIKSSLNAKKE